jgi:hypothetical protein
MGITVVHHAALVLAALWAAAAAGWAHPALYLVALVYIFAVSPLSLPSPAPDRLPLETVTTDFGSSPTSVY